MRGVTVLYKMEIVVILSLHFFGKNASSLGKFMAMQCNVCKRNINVYLYASGEGRFHIVTEFCFGILLASKRNLNSTIIFDILQHYYIYGTWNQMMFLCASSSSSCSVFFGLYNFENVARLDFQELSQIQQGVVCIANKLGFLVLWEELNLLKSREG